MDVRRIEALLEEQDWLRQTRSETETVLSHELGIPVPDPTRIEALKHYLAICNRRIAALAAELRPLLC